MTIYYEVPYVTRGKNYGNSLKNIYIYIILVTTKVPVSLRQKEKLATTVLAIKMTKQQTVSNNTQIPELPTNTILLASSRGVKAILQETLHPFITVTIPARLRNTKTLNTEMRPRVVIRSTSQISASRDIDPRNIFNRTQFRKEMYEPSSSEERTANGILRTSI